MTPRTPFYIAQPIDTVLQVMKRTNRKKIAIKIEGREGTFTINPRRKNDKQVEKELKGLSIDLKQRLTVWYYLPDCTLKFTRYRGLDTKNGPLCYRVISIEDTVSAEELYREPVVEVAAEPKSKCPYCGGKKKSDSGSCAGCQAQ
jgi:hypothetical protein